VTLPQFLPSYSYGTSSKNQYELKALPNNQIKIQLQPLDSYRRITKAVAEVKKNFTYSDQKKKL
jgi:hypothetical protein